MKASRAAPAPPATAGSRLVGRQAEQAALGEALARLGAGAGGLLLVSGDAGAGKTALVESVLSTVDLPVLRGGAHEGGEPYEPLRDALGDRLRRPPEATAEARRWRRRTPAPCLPSRCPLHQRAWHRTSDR